MNDITLYIVSIGTTLIIMIGVATLLIGFITLANILLSKIIVFKRKSEWLIDYIKNRHEYQLWLQEKRKANDLPK